jgi:hypothetical protein
MPPLSQIQAGPNTPALCLRRFFVHPSSFFYVILGNNKRGIKEKVAIQWVSEYKGFIPFSRIIDIDLLTFSATINYSYKLFSLHM